MRAIDLRRAHADPGHVGRQVVPAVLARDEARLRLLVEQVQALVAGEEIHARRLVHRLAAQGLEEIERIADRVRDTLVRLAQLRVTHEAEIPVLGMVQVGEAAVHQRAHEVERQRRALVAAQQQLRIGAARLGGELGAIDQIPAIGRQRHAVARLEVRRARLGVLARHAADAHHRPLHARQQHQAHLQQHLELLGDAIGLALGEALGAVPALQQKALRRAAPLPGARAGSRSPTTPRWAAGAPARRPRARARRDRHSSAAAPPCATASSPDARVAIGGAHGTMLTCALCRGARMHKVLVSGCRQDRRADLGAAGANPAPIRCSSPISMRAQPPACRPRARADQRPAAAAGCHRCRRRCGAQLRAHPVHARGLEPALSLQSAGGAPRRARPACTTSISPRTSRSRAASARWRARRASRIRAAVRPGARLHQHRGRRADPPFRQLAQRAAAGRGAAAASAQRTQVLAHLVHRGADQRIRQSVRGDRRLAG